MDPTQQEMEQAVKDATSPDAPVPRDLRSQVMNPVHMAFRRALLPVLMRNTKAIRPVKTEAIVVKPEHSELLDIVKKEWGGSSSLAKVFGIIYDHMTGSKPGMGAAILKGSATANIFAPLTVCVPTKKNPSSYMLNMPHIVFRVNNNTVQCVYDNGMGNGGWMDVVGAECVPATDDEIFAVVESLTPLQIADMMVHEYFRSILHTVMGIEVDGDPNESDEAPE